MSKRRTVIQTIPTNCPEGRFLRTELSYDLGGPNYFSGGQTQRGYHLHAQLYKTTNGWESFIPTQGYRVLFEPASKFSAKILENLVMTCKKHEMHAKVIEATLAKANLQRISPEPPMGKPTTNICGDSTNPQSESEF